MMGIKRTNANNLGNFEGRKGVILYPTYPLVNSHCYSNTFNSISERDFTMRVHAQRPISKGQEITTRYISSFDCQPNR